MAKLNKDHIDKFFDYDVDTDSRTIYMGSAYSDDYGESGVDHAMAERVIKAIHLLDYAAPNGDKPITVIMNNPGGDYYHGMAIYDAIKNCKNRIILQVYGHAMSMGSIILQAADERQMSANSKFMIHYGYMGMSQNHTKIFELWSRETQRLNYDMENIYLDAMLEKDEAMIEAGVPDHLERTLEQVFNKQNEGSIPPKAKVKIKLSKDPDKRREDLRSYLETMLNFDTILTAKETVALGFADEIIGGDDEDDQD